MSEFAEWLVFGLMLLAAIGIALWMAGAIYFDVAGGVSWAKPLALLWIVGVILLFTLWQPLWQPFAALITVAIPFTTWWLLQKPSHDRDWDPSVARLPRCIHSGDAITIDGVRDFEYHSPSEFTPHYCTRTIHLPNLQGADIIFFNWGSRWMSHPVLVFDFGPDGRIAISIEVRYRAGQSYSVLRSLYRQQELIFVVAEERDIILRRTRYSSNQTAHLYRLQVSVDEVRRAFLDYAETINSLYEKPRWYHGLCANCTTSFYWLPHSRVRLDWRVLANGLLERSLYEAGRLDRSLPFDELRHLAMINEIANHSPRDGFGDHLRRELERRRHAG